MKNNRVSFRISDECMAIINRQAGDNFSQKLENMILYCSKALPEIERQVAQAESSLKKIRHDISDMVILNNRMVSVQRNFKIVEDYMQRIAGDLK